MMTRVCLFSNRPTVHCANQRPPGSGERRRLLQVVVQLALFVDFSLAGFTVAALPQLYLHLDPDVDHPTAPSPDLHISNPLVLVLRHALCFVLSLPAGLFVDVVNANACVAFGLAVNFISAMVCAFGGGAWALNFGVWSQGVGSAFVRVAAVGVLAWEVRDRAQRIKALSVAAIFIFAGALLGPSFGLILQIYVSHICPFLMLGCLSLILAIAMLGMILVGKCTHGIFKKEDLSHLPTVRARQVAWLLIDPCVLICSVCIMAVTCNPAFTPPFIAKPICPPYRVSIDWLYVFFPVLFLTSTTAFAVIKRAWYAWVACALGLWFTGIANVISGITFNGYPGYHLLASFIIQTLGAALFLPGVLILLSFRIDNHHGTPIYGSAYGIANMSATILYIFGSVFGDTNTYHVNLTYTGIFVLLCVPLLVLTSRVHRKHPTKTERKVQDPEQPQESAPGDPVSIPLEPMPSTSGLQSGNVRKDVKKGSRKP